MHIVLLGDSTLDNGAYTAGGPAVPEQLHTLLGDYQALTMLAVDGDTTHSISRRLSGVPEDATHIVLSVGGNDALAKSDVLYHRAGTVSKALFLLSASIDSFDTDYRACVERVLSLGIPTTVCTVYNGAFDIQGGEQTAITTGLRAFNDCIIQCALDHGLNVIDLRRVCPNRSDYANAIEVNSVGGAKIAAAIVEAVSLPTGCGPSIVPRGST